MSILLHYEMVVISVMPTSHLGQSRDLVSGSGGGDLETSDGDMDLVMVRMMSMVLISGIPGDGAW